MAKRKHSTHNSPKHNTTRSGATKDTRPAEAQNQLDKYLDVTGGSNPKSQLSSNTDRGQTLGDGPWNHQPSMPEGYQPSPWS